MVAEVFGEEVQRQLLRVMGFAMARVADAVVSAFLVNVEPAARREDPVGLATARANVEAASLLPLVAPTLDLLFRQHLLAAQRDVLADPDLVGYETQWLVAGFVDLVGSTELGEQLARAAKAARPGEVWVTADLAGAAGFRTEDRGRHRLKGVGSDTELRRVTRS